MSISRIGKFLSIFLLLVFVFGTQPTLAQESEPVSEQVTNPVPLVIFHGDGCPHCAQELEFFEQFQSEYPGRLVVFEYEIYYDLANSSLLSEIAAELQPDAQGVPFTVVGEEILVGFGEGVTDEIIKAEIDRCSKQECINPAIDYLVENDHLSNDVLQGQISAAQALIDESAGDIDHNGNDVDSNGEDTCDTTNEDGECAINNDSSVIELPFGVSIRPSDFSLPVLTIIIGFFDGFNPCAMWVLLYLISMLIGMKDRRRMWILGLTFIIASGFMYFLFMTAWLNLFLFIGFILWVRLGIGAVAIGSGIWHLYGYFKNKDEDDGCEVVQDEQRKKIFGRINLATSSTSLWLAMAGLIALAFSVNLIELVCSMGLPAVYTGVLSGAGLPIWQYYGYLLLYILVFMLDDILIFAIAMKSMRLVGLSTKYVKLSSLIGGIVIIIIGILLIFAPEFLSLGISS